MNHVLAIDQGTTSTRAVLFDRAGNIVSIGQLEHRQIRPQPGWVEHDPVEVWDNTREVIGQALSRASATRHDIAAVGVTNQRETVVVWDRATGLPIHNAIVWQDVRTQPAIDQLAADGGADRFRERVGLPLSPYFSATKIAWILDNVPGARARAERGELLAGTMDSWLLWNLTGGPDGGTHATDVTNASRTMLMDLGTLAWDEQLCEVFGVPPAMLPRIGSSSERFAPVSSSSLLRESVVASLIGDQQAAMFGQAAFDAGGSKATYGTGNFVLLNTGVRRPRSERGLVTTIAYRLGEDAPRFALEGSIAVTGSFVQWLRDNLGIIATSDDVESLARSVPDNGGVYAVPAFSGLLAPHWDPTARGCFVGLTGYATKGHLARAVLEATAFQTREVLDAVAEEDVARPEDLRVDGGMVANDTLMQFQADLIGMPVIRPAVVETTALGAAFAAGLAVGFWSGLDELRGLWREDRRWLPTMDATERDRRVRQWTKAVTRAKSWVDDDIEHASSAGATT